MNRRPAARPKRTFRWGRWLAIALGTMTVAFGIGYMAAVFVLFPAPADAATAIVVPDLAGRSQQEAAADLAGARLAVGHVAAIPHANAAEGTVVAQSPVGGQQLQPGASVDLAVSAGAPRMHVPPVVGFTADRAEMLLRDAGFNVERRSEPGDAPAGRVVGTVPEAGTERPYQAEVVLIVSAGRPDPVLPDSLELDGAVPDTAPEAFGPLPAGRL